MKVSVITFSALVASASFGQGIPGLLQKARLRQTEFRVLEAPLDPSWLDALKAARC